MHLGVASSYRATVMRIDERRQAFVAITCKRFSSDRPAIEPLVVVQGSRAMRKAEPHEVATRIAAADS